MLGGTLPARFNQHAVVDETWWDLLRQYRAMGSSLVPVSTYQAVFVSYLAVPRWQCTITR